MLMKRSLVLFFFLLPLLSHAQRCPDYGDATTQKKKELNKKKNKKLVVPATVEVQYVPLKNFLPRRKRVEKHLYLEGAYVYTEGYMTSADEQGPESCNCRKASKEAKDGDVHMYLSIKADDEKKNSMVVEITPAFKKKFPDYENFLEKNTRIRVYGFLFYDTEHEGNSFTTCQQCRNVWRKTNWEIHPITDIEILEEDEEILH